MAQRLVLYFASEDRALYRLRRGRPELEQRFAPDRQGLAELLQALGRRRGALLHVVTDLAGEDFHEEKIPLLRGSERSAVIERRLAQRYGEARMVAALSLGPAGAERRQERLLLVSLPQSGPLAEWLEGLRQTPLTLASVVSMAMLAPAAARSVGIGGTTVLLVSANSAGVRQSLLEDGRLRFSRLEPAPAGAMSAAFVRREVERTLEYLESSRALADAAPPLRVVVLAAPADLASAEAEFATDGRVALAILAVDQPDLLYLRGAASQPPAGQFLRGADRRPFLAWRLRRAMAAVGASAFAACTGFAGLAWLEGRGVRAESAAVRQQLAPLRAEERRLRALLPETPVHADLLKATVLEFRRIVAVTAAPKAALVHLSGALDQAPEIELDSLVWERSENGGQALEIAARLRASTQGDYREISQHIERFSKLAASGDWRLAGSRMPFEAGPHGALAGDFGDREAAERTRFSLRLAREAR